jgi:SAM-dependent methyltransferase
MKLPNPPAHLLQRIANNPSVNDFVNSFGHLRTIVRGHLHEAGFDFAKFDRILDLGCGVGRFMFAFKDHLSPNQRIWGCDVHKECADWCRANIPFAETMHTNIDPPLPYANSQFDLVYALSVYTHLRLDMQFQWAWEIHRVLRPGGVLFGTFHGPFFFPEFFQAYRTAAKQGELATFGSDGLFAFISFFGKNEDEGQVDVAAAHTPGFFQEQFSAFEICKRTPQSILAAGQDLYIIRKPEHGRTIERPIRSSRKGAEPWAWVEKGTGRKRAAVQLKFNLNGHQMFHVYPSMGPAGIFGVDCRVEVRGGTKVLADHKLPFNNNRVYGRTHHAVVEVPMPDYRGEVTVTLSSQLTDRGLVADAWPDMTWCFPNFT